MRDRLHRVEQAVEALKPGDKLRAKRLKTDKAEMPRQKEPRASTTDSSAHQNARRELPAGL